MSWPHPKRYLPLVADCASLSVPLRDSQHNVASTPPWNDSLADPRPAYLRRVVQQMLWTTSLDPGNANVLTVTLGGFASIAWLNQNHESSLDNSHSLAHGLDRMRFSPASPGSRGQWFHGKWRRGIHLQRLHQRWSPGRRLETGPPT